MNYQGNLATKVQIAKAKDGEARHATFVASSESVDRDGQSMDLASTIILMKDGSKMLVKDIPAEGLTGVDIPLTLNHSFDVGDVIGSVDKVYYDTEKGELTFDARFSTRDKAMDVFKLLEEGHLSNAFSISAFDAEYTNDGRIINGTLNAVGLVERGANQDAKLLAVKDLKPDEEGETAEDGDTAEGATEQNATEESANTDEGAEDGEGTPETATDEAEGDTTDNNTEGEDVEEVATEPEGDKEGTDDMNDEVAKALVKEQPEQKVTVTSTAAKSYLDSAAALHDFSRTIAINKGLGNDAILSQWSKQLAEKGISGDVEKLPTPLVSIFKGWEDNSGILNTLRRTNRATRTVFAFTGENGTVGEDMRAKGHTKGQAKADQKPFLYGRDLRGKLIYKRLPIDLQDLLDDEDGELSLMRTRELLERIDSEAERAVVVGDGRSAGTPDYRIFDDNRRGIYSMAGDIARAAGNGTTSDDYYAKVVATALDNVATDNIYDKIKKTVARVAGARKAAVVAPGLIADLETQKAEGSGVYLFPNGVQLGANVELFERDWMEGSGYDVIAYVGDKYSLFYGNTMIRTDFDTEFNSDIMLAERYASGSAEGYKAIAGYKSAE